MATIESYAKPTWLYRYRPLRSHLVRGEWRADPAAIERELGAIEDGYIYCPRYDQMNDPMEGLYRASSSVQHRNDYEDVIDLIQSEKFSRDRFRRFLTPCAWD